MKKTSNKFFFGKCSNITFMLICAVILLVNFCFRTGYVFIDGAVFNGFSLTLLILAVLSAFFTVFATVLNLKNSEFSNKKVIHIFEIISKIYIIFFTIVTAGIVIVAGKESIVAAFGFFKQAFPFWFAALAVITALFLIPNISKKTVKKFLIGLISAALIFSLYASLFPITPFRFTAMPSVFDNGKDYSVVFSTNDNSTAYLEYEQSGKTVRIYDETSGRKNSDTIHTFHIPYNKLSGSTYKVYATRVIDELSYGGRTGKTIESEKITFNDNLGDNVKALTVSDWHTCNKKAEKAISYLGDYNAVLLLGDCATGINFTEEIEKYILSFAADLSGGKMPVLFVRGNHETRGRQASKLPDYLGMDSFYYTAKLGNCKFIILDSGEDKEDSHPEYGNMVVYAESRKEMVKWLSEQENSDNEKIVALSHDRDICIEEDLSKTALEKLDELGVSFMASGHSHESEMLNSYPFPVLLDGGIDASGDGSYVASKLEITSKNIKITSIDNNGIKVIDETVNWK